MLRVPLATRALVLAVAVTACTGGEVRSRNSGPGGETEDESAVRSRLGYLSEPDYADEVAWYEVDGNDVYIGVKRTNQLHSLVVPAAMECHKVLGRGCHAWAARAEVAKRGWRPGDPGYLCEATVRYGRLQDTDCPEP